VIQFSDTIAVARPPRDVFAFVADLNNIPKWQAEVVTSKVVTPGPTKAGTRFTEDVKMGPMRVTAMCEVTEFAADKMMAFKAESSAISYQGRVVVEPSGTGTDLTISGTANLKGLWKLMQPMMRGEFKSGISKELAAIKAILEK
jgi:carbon monoxide dehydrogenase subunit G